MDGHGAATAGVGEWSYQQAAPALLIQGALAGTMQLLD
jgi:hypothetical protein